MIRLFFTFLFFISLANASSRVYPIKSKTIDPSALNFEFSYLYSQTLSYFDVDGNEIALEEDDDYQLTDYNFSLSYGYTTNIEFGLSGTYRKILSSNTLVTNEAGGLESYAVNAKYSFKSSPTYSTAVSLEYRIHPYENTLYLDSADVPQDEIVLGDSGKSFTGTFYFDSIISKTTTFESSLGFRMPSNDLSAELPYNLALIKNFTSWAFWGGVRGVFSMGQDDYASAPEEKVSNANGQTARWNSINRTYHEPYGGIRVLIANKYRVSFEGGQIMSGSSTDKATNLMASLAWTTGGVSRETRIENSFKEYVAEATIVKLSPRGKFVKIDKGLVQDVSKGASVDIYKSDYFGGNELVASGVIYESGPNWAIVRLVKKYKDIPIEKGLTVRIK